MTPIEIVNATLARCSSHIGNHSVNLPDHVWKRVQKEMMQEIAMSNAPSGWISVDDRLPKKNLIVLTCNCHIDEPAWMSAQCDGEWHATDGTSVEVTHWMPFPEPPKGE